MAMVIGMLLIVLASLDTSAQTPSPVQWSSDGRQFWFLKTTDLQKQFSVVDVASSTTTPAFDHDRVAVSLSELMDQKIGPDDLPIRRMAWGDVRGRWILDCGGQTFELNAETSQLTAIENPHDLFSALLLKRPPASESNGRAIEVEFENRINQPIELLWFRSASSQPSYGVIQPGDRRSQATFEGHVWVIKMAGQTVGYYQAQRDGYLRVDTEAIDRIKRAKPIRRSVEGRRKFSRQISPDQKWAATIEDHNLWLRPKAKSSDRKPVGLTTDGTRDNTFEYIGKGTHWRQANGDSGGGDFQWSPDSKFLVAFQTKRVDEPRVHYIESSPAKGLQPKLRSYSYPKPGDELLIQKLRLFSVDQGKEIPVSNQLFNNPFWTRFLGWSDDGTRFRLLYNQRGHQVMRLIEVTADTGNVKTLIQEQSDTFIHYSEAKKSVLKQLPDRTLLWASERSGWNHLYRFDGQSGELVNSVTQGRFNVKGIVHIDPAEEAILFYAVGVYADQDPYHEHLCRVQFDGSGFQILTQGDGTHRIRLIRDGQFFVDSYSRVDLAPVKEIRDTKTGKLIAEIERQNTVQRFGNRRLPERFVAKGRDGKTDIWGIIHWPKDFDPQKKYPIVESIYAGPHDQHVPKSFAPNYPGLSEIADAGMIVVQIDGMGTAWRSKAFHDVCYKNLRDAGFPDRIAWMKAAAKKFPQLDVNRVGICGGSAGGQNAMAALLWHHDFYHVAVADSGCHDNRMDKIWWNEQFMGWPVDDSYRENSNRDNAGLLQGKLMLIVGEADRNVDPATTIQVVQRLIEAGKDFEFVFVPGGGHCPGSSGWAAKKRLAFLKRCLDAEH